MSLEMDGPHWRFSLKVYSGEGVAESCLALQDRHGVDVNVLLVALYAELQQGRKIGQQEIAQLDGAIVELRDRIIRPLREMRRFLGASISSGSYRTIGMLVAPCSIRTLSGIANSYNEELVVRAADVCLKERRKVVLMLRETPLHAGHIELMERATRNGAIVMPPVPAFYHRPATIDDIINQSVGRALDLFGIDPKIVRRWQEEIL